MARSMALRMKMKYKSPAMKAPKPVVAKSKKMAGLAAVIKKG